MFTGLSPTPPITGHADFLNNRAPARARANWPEKSSNLPREKIWLAPPVCVPTASEDSIKAKVCEYALILRDCETSLMIEMTPIAAVSDIPTTATTCADRTGDTTPLSSFATGGRSEIMYVRAGAIVDPIFPGMGIGLQLPKDASGGFALLATSVFVNEPE